MKEHQAETEVYLHTGVLDWLVPGTKTRHRCVRLSWLTRDASEKITFHISKTSCNTLNRLMCCTIYSWNIARYWGTARGQLSLHFKGFFCKVTPFARFLQGLQFPPLFSKLAHDWTLRFVSNWWGYQCIILCRKLSSRTTVWPWFKPPLYIKYGERLDSETKVIQMSTDVEFESQWIVANPWLIHTITFFWGSY